MMSQSPLEANDLEKERSLNFVGISFPNILYASN